MSDDPRIRRAVQAALDKPVQAAFRLSGGDVAEAYRVELVGYDRPVFAKTRVGSRPDFFIAEANGLEQLRLATSGLDWLRVPEVLAVDDGRDGLGGLLVLEWIDEGRRSSRSEAAFGEALAQMHRRPATNFGRGVGLATGSLGFDNSPCSTWAEFYGDRRLRPLAEMCSGFLTAQELDALVGVADSLGRLPGADEPAVFLHGDLWGGNRLVDAAGVSWLIDPAFVGGHREFDLAMMSLFGGFGPEVFAQYRRNFELAPGFEERVCVFQLAPLLVHGIKFGGSYLSASRRAIEAAAALVRRF